MTELNNSADIDIFAGKLALHLQVVAHHLLHVCKTVLCDSINISALW